MTNVGSAQSSAASMFKIAGGWGNVNGPGIFMLRVIVAGATTATFMGLCSAMLASMVWGTAALPFIAGSCAGFILGTTSWYYDALSKALLTVDRYPSMLRLHLDANFPTKFFRREPLGLFRSERFKSSQILQSMLVVAWLTAQPALDVSTLFH